VTGRARDAAQSSATAQCLAVLRDGHIGAPENGGRVLGTMWRCSLTPAQARQAWELAGECRLGYPSVDDSRFLRDVSVIAHELPGPLRKAVNGARLDDRLNALVVSGNVTADETLGPTPRHWRQADTDSSRTHAFLLALYGALLGDAICWATQQGGRVVHDVLPVPGAEMSLLSSSSHKELGWHTEDAFSSCRADYVGLLCLRNPQDIPTTMSCLDSAAIPPDVAAILASEHFTIAPDDSHGADQAGDGESAARPPLVRLLAGAPEAPVLRIDRDFTSVPGNSPSARRALEWLIRHLDGNTYEMILRPGDTCFIDNRNVVHGRRSFRPRYDGRDRWLKRINIVVDLRRTRHGRADSQTRAIG
jgi:Fe(II)/alpha-ketoglutarate-dependent arginine beta-hydroxylase